MEEKWILPAEIKLEILSAYMGYWINSKNSQKLYFYKYEIKENILSGCASELGKSITEMEINLSIVEPMSFGKVYTEYCMLKNSRHFFNDLFLVQFCQFLRNSKVKCYE